MVCKLPPKVPIKVAWWKPLSSRSVSPIRGMRVIIRDTGGLDLQDRQYFYLGDTGVIVSDRGFSYFTVRSDRTSYEACFHQSRFEVIS